MSFSSLIRKGSALNCAVMGLVWLTACAPTTERGLRAARPKEFFDLSRLDVKAAPPECSESTPEYCHQEMQKVMTERTRLQTDLKRLQDQEAEAKVREAQLSDELAKLKASSTADTNEVKSALETELQSVRTALAEIQAKADQCEAQSVITESQIAQLRIELQDARTGSGDLTAVVSQGLASEVVQQFETKIEGLEKVIADLRTELAHRGETDGSTNQSILDATVERDQLITQLCEANPSHPRCSPAGEGQASAGGSAEVSTGAAAEEGALGEQADATGVAGDGQAAVGDATTDGQSACLSSPKNSAGLIDLVFPAMTLYRQMRTGDADSGSSLTTHLSFDADLAFRALQSVGDCSSVSLFPIKLVAMKPLALPLQISRSATDVSFGEAVRLKAVPIQGQDTWVINQINSILTIGLQCMNVDCSRLKLVISYTPRTGDDVVGHIAHLNFKALNPLIVDRSEMVLESSTTEVDGASVRLNITSINEAITADAAVASQLGSFERPAVAVTTGATAGEDGAGAIESGPAADPAAPDADENGSGTVDQQGEPKKAERPQYTIPV